MGSITYNSFIAAHDGASGVMKQATRVLVAFAAASLGQANVVSAKAAAFPAASGTRYAVATDTAQASHAAVDTLEHGGNAADAAVAAALTLGVVSPAGSGLGGGGFALVYMKKTGTVVAVDFRETAPLDVDVAFLSSRTAPVAGDRRAVGIPGEPWGLEHITKQWGRRTLADNVHYAARIASQGFEVPSHTRAMYTEWGSRLTVGGELQRALASGALRIARPQLARTLTEYGASGAVDKPRAAAPIETTPLRWNALGYTWFSMPLPSAGGMMLRQVTSAASGPMAQWLPTASAGSSSYDHALAELFRGALVDRAFFAGDPRSHAWPSNLFEPDRLAARWALFDPNKTMPLRALAPREHGTSHVVVVDAEGNVVSLTTTINSPFGSGIEDARTGILLNDELYDFSSRAEEEAMGVPSPGPNAPSPCARPVSSMTPTIALQNGELAFALGGSGGPRIATGVTQVALCLALHKRDPGACVAASRMHVGWDNTVLLDDDIVLDVQDGLKARGESVRTAPNGSAVQVVAAIGTPAGVVLKASADPRKRGLAIAH